MPAKNAGIGGATGQRLCPVYESTGGTKFHKEKPLTMAGTFGYMWECDDYGMGTVGGTKRMARRMKLPVLREPDLYLDASTLEVFVNGGEAVLTSRIFGQDDTVTVVLFAGAPEFIL